MNYAEIKYCDIANGEGVRTTLFVSGCTHHCKNCFQSETWSFSYGEEFTDAVAQKIIASLSGVFVDGITLLGGEPMEPENQRALLPFVRAAKQAYPEKTIWCYTGDVFEDLTNPESKRHTEATEELLTYIDAVSYTHLDVYKRQAKILKSKRILIDPREIGGLFLYRGVFRRKYWAFGRNEGYLDGT